MSTFIVNGKNIQLTQQQFVAKGGEGMVYKVGSIAYKIYEDLKKMVPEAKLKELSEIATDNIIAPLELIYNKKQQIVGFTSMWAEGIALCKLFTNSFRQNNSVENDHILELVENMKEVTAHIHEKKFLIVDGNELNYIVGNDFVTPYFIDTNAWQTPSFPPTAIMPSVRDYRSKDFSPVTDWFSFAIVSFQLFIGVHPFKGKHPKYKVNDFENRIKDCVSVLNSETRLPRNTRDFGVIPSEYMDWYLKLFEKGERILPPIKPGQIGHVVERIILVKSTDNFDIKEIKEFNSNILYHSVVSGTEVTKTENHLEVGGRKHKVGADVEVIFTPMEKVPIMLKIKDGFAEFYCPDKYYTILPFVIHATDKMIINNVLFLKNKEKLVELQFNVMGQNIAISPKVVWKIEPNSSQLFSNMVVQSVLGKAYIAIPLADYHKTNFIIKAIPELDEYRILDAKHENMVCIFTLHKDGEYSRATLIFDTKYDKYVIRIKEGIDYTPINFTALDNGICINITDDEAVEIFLNRIDKPDVKRIEDPAIDSTMHLCHDGVQVRFFSGKKLFSMKMK
jgi:hypothetical protein